MKLDKDRLNGADLRRTGNAAMAFLTVFDTPGLSIEEKIAGMSVSFLAACKTHGVRPLDLFTVTENMVNGAEGRRPEFAGVYAYMENETK